MADNFNYTNPSSGSGVITVGADLCTVNGVPDVSVGLGKLGFGDNDLFTYVTTSSGLPTQVVAALPAGTNVIGAAVPSNQVLLNGSLVTLQTVPISASSSGDNTLVAATAGKKIYVYSFRYKSAGTVSVTFKTGSAAGGSNAAISGAFPEVAGSGIGGSGGFFPVMITASGELLNLNLSGAVQVSGMLTYAVG